MMGVWGKMGREKKDKDKEEGGKVSKEGGGVERKRFRAE